MTPIADPTPEEVLTYLIVTLLTPMFLLTTDGDLALARAAAAHTVSVYTARNPIDLILIAQTIALGLAVLSSVSLSMAENLPINLVVRLRGNATSLNRAAETCRRALSEPPPAIATTAARNDDFHEQAEAAVVAEVARTQAKAAAWKASITQPTPAPLPQAAPESRDSPPTMKAALAAIEAESKRRIAQADTALKATGAPMPPATSSENERHRSTWCSAMADVAGEFTAELANLSPAERRAAGMRLAALNSTANTLARGIDPYQTG